MKICELINAELAPTLNRETIGTMTEAVRLMFASYSIPVVLQEIDINDNVVSIDVAITEDGETEEFEIHFLVLDDEPYALVSEEDEEDTYAYPLINIATKTKFNNGEIVNLIEPAWLEESVFIDILTSDIESDIEFELEEASTYVIRKGKKVKKKLVINKRRKRLSAKQRAGIRKAVKSRRAKKGQTARKRKISNRLRKRMKIKRNTNKRLKVAGTSGKKR